MAQSYVLSIISPLGPLDLRVETPSPGALMNMCLLHNQRLFLKSSGHMFASQANNHGVPHNSHLLHYCFHQRFTSQCPAFRVPEENRKDSYTSSHSHPCLGHSSLIAKDPSSLPITATELLSTATKLLPTCVCDPHCLLAISCCIGCKSPTLFGFFR